MGRRGKSRSRSTSPGSPRPEYFLDLVDPGIVEDEAVLIKTFQAWLAYCNLRSRITAALDGQQRLDENTTRKKSFRAWKQVTEIRVTRQTAGVLKSTSSATPLKDMADVYTPVTKWTGSVLNLASHRKAVGVKLLIDVRQTLCCRVTLVAWRAMVAVQQVIMRGPEGQAQILAGGGRGWSAQQWQHRILSYWMPQRIRRKFFCEWQFAVQRKIRRAIRRRMMLKSGYRLLPRMQKPREQLLTAKVFTKWSQHCWLIHADAVFQFEREHMQKSFHRRLKSEQTRALQQSEAVQWSREQEEAEEGQDTGADPSRAASKLRFPPRTRGGSKDA